MNAEDLFERLSFGELSNLSIGMDGAGEIAVDQQPKVLSYINLGLTALYTRFTHKRDYVQFQLSESRTRYRLSLENARSQNEGGFILDSAEEPFADDVVKILEVVQEDDPATLIDEHEILGINIRGRDTGVKTLAYDTLFIKEPVAGRILTVEYQANHPRLRQATDPIELAPILEEALEMFVAGKVYSSMNGEANLVKARSLSGRYEQICAMVAAEDLLQLTSSSGHDKLHAKGFV